MPADRTIHVVDDDAGVRRSLERLLHAAGFAAVSYPTPELFLEAAPGLASGCVLLDVRMPGMDGLTLQAELRARGSALPVIMMTGQGDVAMAVRAMKEGAADFIEKPFDDGALITALEAALRKTGLVGRDREAAAAAERIANLSPREREVLEGLVGGRSNKEIAYDLGLSVRTVEVHRSRMMERLDVGQFAEAIRLAVLARLGS
jgi:two-component system, LuxR family, response regulator FixJ